MEERGKVIVSVQAYLNKAHHLLIEAEDLANQGQSEARKINDGCLQALVLLLQAFLIYKGEKNTEEESIDQLFSRCAYLEEDFYNLEEAIAYLTMEDHHLTAEEIADQIDAANEVWDFVLGCLPEKYHL
ncbi:MAG TPA: hypothetical protein GXZ36_08560 [Firmicutes bacterium]|nr:hypothetical protein [Bacillota bacterium]